MASTLGKRVFFRKTALFLFLSSVLLPSIVQAQLILESTDCLPGQTSEECFEDLTNQDPNYGPEKKPIVVGTTRAECEKIEAEQKHPNCKNVLPLSVEGNDNNANQACVLFEIQKCFDKCTDCGGAGGGNPTRGKPAGYDGPIPDCAFEYEGCDDINDLLQLIVNIGEFVFKIVGTAAFVFFIYGGVTMIASFGSADKFQKGKDILTAAVIGLVITFSAYLLIQFILQTLGVSADLQSIK